MLDFCTFFQWHHRTLIARVKCTNFPFPRVMSQVCYQRQQLNTCHSLPPRHSTSFAAHPRMWDIFLIVVSSLKISSSRASTYPSSTTSTRSAAGEGCPLGWIDNGDLGCFLFAADRVGLSWVEALEYCEEQVRNPKNFFLSNNLSLLTGRFPC